MKIEQLTQNVQHKIMTHHDSGQPSNGWVCTCGAKGWPDTQHQRDRHLREAGAMSRGKLTKQMIYLASPHTHTSAEVRQDRYQAALRCTSWLIERGFWVFSPIVHSHNLPCNYSPDRISWDWWKEFDTETIRRMDELWVLVIPGTWESKGVRAEIEIAKLQGKRIMTITERCIDIGESLGGVHHTRESTVDYVVVDLVNSEHVHR